jgi:predicted ATPase
MLKQLDVKAFKCIEEQSFQLAPLTLVTGTNASGKSTVLQAILIGLSYLKQDKLSYLRDLVKPYVQLEDVLCRTAEARQVDIGLTTVDEQRFDTFITELAPGFRGDRDFLPYAYEETLFYLSANRGGPEELAELSKELLIGPHGQYALGYLEQHKDKPLSLELCRAEAPAQTLKAQLAWWLSYITGTECEAVTDKVTSTRIKLSFVMGELGEVSPLNTGAGNSYLLKLLIMCLAAKPGHLVLIENPEIHLHPGAQSRLGEFFAYLASRGVQLVIETHCEHLINRVRYEVYRQTLGAADAVVHYKQSPGEPFTQLGFLPSGHFCDEQDKPVNFPTGFFDSTLGELLEMG